ncbi:hypothetical protein BOTBODRAFT_51734 [Botryobasidium botryosum FD-172 SS1]|uniref:C3HC-type domain-containing protein n=1 Tax=Botryobasidium botryosum (strain FD-172 SS1) TaxID=930990 RepID=A0A067N5B2_BOTB1|nr:hypothetical protein BOTBODRAFT_51734 [Botryobasidium botryosum FD-172 SS1]
MLFGMNPSSFSLPSRPSSRTPVLNSILSRSHSVALRSRGRSASTSTNVSSASAPLPKSSSSNGSPNLPSISHPLPLSSKPPYRPSSSSDFLTRLATFKFTTYRDKPAVIDAAAASRCGWKNDGKDRLVCDNCGNAWVVAGTGGLGRDAANTLVERQKAALVTSHKDTCPWRKRQCEPSIYRIPLTSSTAAARDVRSRALYLTPMVHNVSIKHPLTAGSLSSVQNAMSSISSPVPTATASSSSHPPSPPTSAPNSPLLMSQPSEKAVILALFGWQAYGSPPSPSSGRPLSRSGLPGRPDSLSRASSPPLRTTRTASLVLPLDFSAPVLGSTRRDVSSSASIRSVPVGPGYREKDAMLHCALCQRRLGLWAFTPRGTSSPHLADLPDNDNASMDSLAATATAHGTASTSTSGTAAAGATRSLDVLKEHRSFCPYVVRSTPIPPLPSLSPPSAKGKRGGGAEDALVEGWKAVVNVVGRCGMGMRVRRRSGIAGLGTSGSAGVTSEGGGDDEDTMSVDNLVENVKRGGSKDLLRFVKNLLS